MSIASRPPAGFRWAYAFTLIEMLAVMAIAGVLLALIVPAVVSSLRNMNINKALTLVNDELSLDAQLAVSRNRDVQIHFYSLGAGSNATDVQYRAFRSFALVGNSTVPTPAGNVRFLPEPIIVSAGTDASGSKVSTILDTTASGPVSGSENMPGVANPVPYVSFTFRASGGTSLSITGNWYLTVYAESTPVNPTTGVPYNYFTIQVDPVTAKVRTYRP